MPRISLRRSPWDTATAGYEGEAMNVDVLRYAAFTNDPTSGNLVGVMVNAGQLTSSTCWASRPGSATQKPRSSPRRSPIDAIRQGRPPTFKAAHIG